MADDERRAEIEAVARALAVDSGWCYSPHFYRGLAEVAVTTLDRVRDARGDDEVNTDVAVAQIQRAQADAAARSPQGEDHETDDLDSQALAAAGSALDPSATDPVRAVQIATKVVRAYLSRVSSSRPEQPPPDTLGGQPPAEPPEAP